MQRKTQGKHKTLISDQYKKQQPSLHPEKNCQKCYYVMSATIKRKSTITKGAFKNWTEHSVQHCHICEGIQLFEKGVVGTQKSNLKKKSKSTSKAERKVHTKFF